MVNGLLTLRGAWDKLRDDPVLKFLAVAVTYYGMSTFEGPILSIKRANAVSHYTDWTIGHVHAGTLGWNAFLSFGILYWVVPRLWKTKLYSIKLAEAHFWIGTIGIMLYQVSMWVAGITQWAMWRGLRARRPADLPRLHRDGRCARPTVLGAPDGRDAVLHRPAAARLQRLPDHARRAGRHLRGGPGQGHAIGPRALRRPAPSPRPTRTTMRSSGSSTRCVTACTACVERRFVVFTVLTALAISVGSLVEGVPMFVNHQNVKTIASVTPYRPLEVLGRDIYLREGCYTCHSQMVRPFRARDRALRRVLEGRRVRLRPPVPVGLEAHGAGPASRRRQVPAPLARAAHDGPELDDARARSCRASRTC